MRLLALSLLLILTVPTQASHSFGGLDMCALYPEVMPPGLSPEQLPDPQGRGATLLQTYCEQCHALPGPGRHTAEEWPGVFRHMLTLMDVGNRFGGLLGHVRTPDATERAELLAYLQRHGLQPLQARPTGLGASQYETHCAACHSLPDPARYSAGAWSEVLKRMQRHMQIMQYAAPSADNLLQIQLFLQSGARTPAQADDDTGALPPRPGALHRSGHYVESSLALGPFLLLVLVGLARRVRHHSEGED